jgi:hypothetical protein
MLAAAPFTVARQSASHRSASRTNPGVFIDASILTCAGASATIRALPVIVDWLIVAADSRINDRRGSHAGSLMRLDGNLVSWAVACPPVLGIDGLPLLIRHEPDGVEWGPAALEARRSQVHPIGSPVRLARLDLAAADPAARAADHAAQLGIEFWAVADLAVVTLGTHVMRLRPLREMSLPVVVTLEADIEAPRTADLFGVRFDVAPVPAAVAVGA